MPVAQSGLAQHVDPDTQNVLKVLGQPDLVEKRRTRGEPHQKVEVASGDVVAASH